MERFKVDSCKIEQVTKITVTLDLATDDKVAKEYIIYEGDSISFLYTENFEDVGKNDKIVRGKVVGIMQKPRFNIKQLSPNGAYHGYTNLTHLSLSKREKANFDDIVLVIDESKTHEAIINKYPLSKILDINPVDYIYPEDNPSNLDTSSGLSTFGIGGERIHETKIDPNSSGNPYPVYPSSYCKASSADYKERGVTDGILVYSGEYSQLHGFAECQAGEAKSNMGVAESQLGIAEAVNPLGVATPDMISESEIGVATPEMDGGVLKL